MSREWTVHAQLTISQPSVDQDNVVGQDPDQKNQNGGTIAEGDVQKSEKPITITYQWTTADDPNVKANHLTRGGSSGNAQIGNNSVMVRDRGLKNEKGSWIYCGIFSYRPEEVIHRKTPAA